MEEEGFAHRKHDPCPLRGPLGAATRCRLDRFKRRHGHSVPRLSLQTAEPAFCPFSRQPLSGKAAGRALPRTRLGGQTLDPSPDSGSGKGRRMPPVVPAAGCGGQGHGGEGGGRRKHQLQTEPGPGPRRHIPLPPGEPRTGTVSLRRGRGPGRPLLAAVRRAACPRRGAGGAPRCERGRGAAGVSCRYPPAPVLWAGSEERRDEPEEEEEVEAAANSGQMGS